MDHIINKNKIDLLIGWPSLHLGYRVSSNQQAPSSPALFFLLPKIKIHQSQAQNKHKSAKKLNHSLCPRHRSMSVPNWQSYRSFCTHRRLKLTLKTTMRIELQNPVLKFFYKIPPLFFFQARRRNHKKKALWVFHLYLINLSRFRYFFLIIQSDYLSSHVGLYGFLNWISF